MLFYNIYWEVSDMEVKLDISSSDDLTGTLAWGDPFMNEWIRINSLGLVYVKSGIRDQSMFNIVGVDMI
jgi:hypothetical protein